MRWVIVSVASLATVAMLVAGCGVGEERPAGPGAIPTRSQGERTPVATKVPSAALDVVAASAANFLYQPLPEETLEDVAQLWSGAKAQLSVEELVTRNRLASTSPPLPLLAIPLFVSSGLPFPVESLRAALREDVALVVPGWEVIDGYRGLLALRRVELSSARPADGYILGFWETTSPVTKGGAVDPTARFTGPAFAIAAGSFADAQTFADGERYSLVLEGTRVTVTVAKDSLVGAEAIAAGLRTWR